VSRRPLRPARRPAARAEARLLSEPGVLCRPGARRVSSAPRTPGRTQSLRPSRGGIRPPGRGHAAPPPWRFGRPTDSRARRGATGATLAAPEEGGHKTM
jgi:hypothetical protein